MSLKSPEPAGALAPVDVRARLDELRDMQDGWLEGQGVAPPHDGLDWLADSFDGNYPDSLCLPYLYPTFDGGIQAEWSFPSREINLEVDLNTHQANWYNLDLQADADEITQLNLDDPDVWVWIANEIRRVSAGAHE